MFQPKPAFPLQQSPIARSTVFTAAVVHLAEYTLSAAVCSGKATHGFVKTTGLSSKMVLIKNTTINTNRIHTQYSLLSDSKKKTKPQPALCFMSRELAPFSHHLDNTTPLLLLHTRRGQQTDNPKYTVTFPHGPAPSKQFKTYPHSPSPFPHSYYKRGNCKQTGER